MWAIAYRSQPYRDTEIVEAPPFTLDPAAVPPGASRGLVTRDKPPRSTALLIDATMPWAYPPLSLPKREFMERAIEMWQSLQLPALNSEGPLVWLLAGSLDRGRGAGSRPRRARPPLRDRRKAETDAAAVWRVNALQRPNTDFRKASVLAQESWVAALSPGVPGLRFWKPWPASS